MRRLGQLRAEVALRAPARLELKLTNLAPVPWQFFTDPPFGQGKPDWGWPRGYVEPLAEHALFASPTADTGLLVRHARRAIIVDELLEGRAPSRDPYFRHHVLSFGYRHEIQFMCVSTGLPRALFTFNRKAEKGAFEPRHLRLLEAVSPHVAAAVHARVRARRSRRAPGGGYGVRRDGPEGRSRGRDATGRRLLARASEHRLLPLSVFLGLVRRGLRDGKPPSVRTMSFTDTTSGELYRLGGEQTTGADGELRGLVLMEPARPFESPMGLLCLGLTPREASVVAELLRDENLVACAHRLGCAPGTVAKHVKNVYAKLSVGSRRELALRLMAHAPNVGAGPAGLP